MEPTSDMDNEKQLPRTKPAARTIPEYLIGGLFALMLISAQLGLLFLPGDRMTAFTTVIALMTAALVLVVVLPRVKEFGFGRLLEAKLDAIAEGQNVLKSDVEEIRLALRGILTKHEFGPLKALGEPGKAEIQKPARLDQYLHRLDGLDFIQPNKGKGLNDIANLPDGTLFDLREYLYITVDGQKYLDITTKLDIFKPGVDWHDSHPFNPLPPSR
jgi:hypothetical protein